MKGGPNWKKVKYRVTLNSLDGSIIDVEDKNKMTREIEHRRIYDEPIDATTILLYETSAGTTGYTESAASLKKTCNRGSA